MGGPFFIL